MSIGRFFTPLDASSIFSGPGFLSPRSWSRVKRIFFLGGVAREHLRLAGEPGDVQRGPEPRRGGVQGACARVLKEGQNVRRNDFTG